MTDDLTHDHLRALLADATARAEKAEAERDALKARADVAEAEIARLRAEVERLRDYERIHGVRSNEIGRLKAEVERLRDGFDVQVEAITRRDRALAAGPAALRAHGRSEGHLRVASMDGCAEMVEAAQAAAMKEGT